MKRVERLVVAAAGIALIFLGLPTAALAAPKAKVKLATLAPKGSSFHQVLLEMGEKWRDAPGGGVTLTIYTDGTMGSEADMVRRMRVGQIQAAMLTVTGLSEIDDSVAALQNMPMMFRSLDELEFVRDKLRPDLEGRLREKGFIVLFWGDAGWVRFFSRKPGKMPGDFTSMKMFVSAGDNRTLDVWKLAGYQPVPLEVTDILPGLQTGLIDAVCSSPSYSLAGQFYGPAPNMLDLHWAPLVGGTVITQKAWDALPAESKHVLMSSAADAGAKITSKSRAENEESIDAMKKRGLNVVNATPEIEAAWRQKCEESYPKIRGSIVPAERFDEVRKLLDEYRRTREKAAP
jgi:TRAP-type C4-dicarboxylate transport system substrate-binding protein